MAPRGAGWGRGGAARPEPSGAEGLSGGGGKLAASRSAGVLSKRGLLRAPKNRPPPPCRRGREPERRETESEGGAADGVV